MKRKIYRIFRIFYIVITIALCIGYIDILLSGFLFGSYAAWDDNGLKYRAMYILLAVVFPIAVLFMYYYIEYLLRKIFNLENEIGKLQETINEREISRQDMKRGENERETERGFVEKIEGL